MKKLASALMIGFTILAASPGGAVACGECCCCCDGYYREVPRRPQKAHHLVRRAAPEDEPQVVIFTGNDFDKFTSWMIGWVVAILACALAFGGLWIIAGWFWRRVDDVRTPAPAVPDANKERQTGNSMEFLEGL